jgi:exopolyphosphatase / guanosine-5'-triphosphate,3'-diphosphate pyrophosphatase
VTDTPRVSGGARRLQRVWRVPNKRALPIRRFHVFRQHMSPAPVAIIDIGSNSIKVLVAARDSEGRITPLKIRTIDARIGTGIGTSEPGLTEAAMSRGLEAISALLADVQEFAASKIALVATSAVRDARNGAEFRQRVYATTGHAVRILSGDEEANLIGRGLTCDPALRDLRDFYVFDLGGGSLECLAFRNRGIEQAASLQLGCVRMMEKFVEDPTRPFSPAARDAVVAHTRCTVGAADFKFSLPRSSVAVGTGGTVTTVRAILGAREGIPFDRTNPIVTLAQLNELLSHVGGCTLMERRQVPGLPPARADVFPTALATLIAIAELGGFAAFQNSVYNLRYGVASELLEAIGH